ncbi:MAG: Bug family tripartite tricarboxylate transporter substrate binding protein [Burkholderiales bacterium]
MRTIRSLGTWAVLILLACGTAWAQSYPAKPVRVVIVFPPGGATDIVGRIVFRQVGEQLGQQFIIDNRPGASGTLGASLVAQSPADGYTLMVYSTTLISSAHLYKNLPYDTMKDFVGLSPVAQLIGMLTVHPSMPVRTVKDLVTLAKKRPGEISYGTAGMGSFQHLATSLFTSMAGIDIVHVPYKGGGPASLGTASGEVQVILTPISEVLPYLKSKRLRPIAVSSAKRTAQFPDVPAIAETVKGYEWTSWMGTFAPAGTPRDIVEKLNAELKKAVAAPAVASNLSSQSLVPMYMTLDEFAREMKVQYDRYAKVIKLSGARIQ